MRLTKTLGLAGALILSALVGGTLIGSALAVDEETVAGSAAGTYCQTFMDTFAAELGATSEEVVSAGKAAANAALDAAVAAGDITEERATAARERIDAADGTGCGWLGHGIARGFGGEAGPGFGPGFGRGMAHGFLGGDVFEAAASALGIESAALIERLGEAASLEALATEEGVAYADVKTSVLAAVQSDLDAAVAEGLDQAHADAVIERLTTWLDEGGQLDGLRPGRGHFGPGRGGFGPWAGHDDAEDADAEASDA